jgi:hypothetical protein
LLAADSFAEFYPMLANMKPTLSHRGPMWTLSNNRTYDVDGRMHGAQARITRSGVWPYRGDEIANWEQLGFDGDRVYWMYRPLDELKSAAATFNTVPLYDRHITGEHRSERVIGALGTDARVVGDSLHCSLSIWARRGNDAVEYGTRSALSAAYNYCADMTAGVTADGKAYEGIQRHLEALHVALCRTPRTADCSPDAGR